MHREKKKNHTKQHNTAASFRFEPSADSYTRLPDKLLCKNKYLRVRLLLQLCYSTVEGTRLLQMRLRAGEAAGSLEVQRAAQLLKVPEGRPHCEA